MLVTGTALSCDDVPVYMMHYRTPAGLFCCHPRLRGIGTASSSDGTALYDNHYRRFWGRIAATSRSRCYRGMEYIINLTTHSRPSACLLSASSQLPDSG